MTCMYRTTGRLTTPVKDISLANEYLDEEMEKYIGFHHPDLTPIVFTVRWRLTTEERWEVTVVTTRRLTDDESTRLSDWIHGQNSDGLGEGFEQQAFAEHFETDEWGDMDDDSFEMSSFDWDTNDCPLELLKDSLDSSI